MGKERKPSGGRRSTERGLCANTQSEGVREGLALLGWDKRVIWGDGEVPAKWLPESGGLFNGVSDQAVGLEVTLDVGRIWYGWEGVGHTQVSPCVDS